MNIFSRILNFFFPRACAGCGQTAEEASFCPSCRNAARKAEAPLPLADAFAVWSYRDPRVRRAVWRLKYRGDTSIAKIFAEELYDKILEELAERELFSGKLSRKNYLVIPIPLSPKRQRERGFNQSALIARELLKLLQKSGGETFALAGAVLAKERNTPHQTALKRKDRLANLAGAFAVQNPDAVRGCRAILIDDVITTGATLSEARRALLAAGAERVYAAAVAH